MIKPKYKELDFSSFRQLQKNLKEEGSLTCLLIGNSMAPLYKPLGESLQLHPVKDITDLKRFDIIVFWQSNILISHYFWQTNRHFNEDPNDPNLLTRPLNPIKSFDHPIRFGQILGIVEGKKIGFWLKFKIYWNLFF